jgi:hypothetical protein
MYIPDFNWAYAENWRTGATSLLSRPRGCTALTNGPMESGMAEFPLAEVADKKYCHVVFRTNFER